MGSSFKYGMVTCACCWMVIACNRSAPVYERRKLSETVDSVIYADLKFGISRRDFLERSVEPPVENKMTEPAFGYAVTEVEGSVLIDSHPFRVFYYFDAEDSLYQVKAEYKSMDSIDHTNTYTMIGLMLYDVYGVPERWGSISDWKKFRWKLSNKQIMMEYGCFLNDCFVEINIQESRLFNKNKNRLP